MRRRKWVSPHSMYFLPYLSIPLFNNDFVFQYLMSVLPPLHLFGFFFVRSLVTSFLSWCDKFFFFFCVFGKIVIFWGNYWFFFLLSYYREFVFAFLYLFFFFYNSGSGIFNLNVTCDYVSLSYVCKYLCNFFFLKQKLTFISGLYLFCTFFLFST